MKLADLVERLGGLEALDRAAKPLAGAVAKVVPAPGRLKDLLSGTWLGHPLHPMLTDVPIGMWTSALLLDLTGDRDGGGARAADRLAAAGLVAAVPTMAAGASDWSDYLGGERRVGLVHAVANVVAAGCYGSSLVATRAGAPRVGRGLRLAGFASMMAGGYLGGHLSYTKGVNVNRNAFDHRVQDWTPVLDESDLAEGRPVVVEVEGTPVMVMRDGDGLVALADRCGHAGGPLHEGEVSGGCVTCPWHASTFRLADGGVVHGPATTPQPRFETKVEAGKVLVRSSTGAAATTA